MYEINLKTFQQLKVEGQALGAKWLDYRASFINH